MHSKVFPVWACDCSNKASCWRSWFGPHVLYLILGHTLKYKHLRTAEANLWSRSLGHAVRRWWYHTRHSILSWQCFLLQCVVEDLLTRLVISTAMRSWQWCFISGAMRSFNTLMLCCDVRDVFLPLSFSISCLRKVSVQFYTLLAVDWKDFVCNVPDICKYLQMTTFAAVLYLAWDTWNQEADLEWVRAPVQNRCSKTFSNSIARLQQNVWKYAGLLTFVVHFQIKGPVQPIECILRKQKFWYTGKRFGLPSLLHEGRNNEINKKIES